MSWFFIRNHSQSELEELDTMPWDLKVPPIPKRLKNKKAEYRRWCLNEKTDHVFFTGVEAVDPNYRVSAENPALKIHGLVADWDGATDLDKLNENCQKIDIDLRPRYIGQTFSGGARGVWVFEEPVWVDCEETTKQFLINFFRNVEARKLAPGFDECSLDLSQVWEIGTGWREVDESIETPARTTQTMRIDSIGKTRKIKEKYTEIPLEEVQKAIDEKFPGRLYGAKIEKGARIPLFWLPPGDGKQRDKSAIVAEWGVYSFTTRAEKGRWFWDELLGRDFVRKYTEKKIEEGTRDTYYDGRLYWWQVGDRWVARVREDAQLMLKNEGFSSVRKEGDTASEVEQALFAIQQGSIIDSVAPFTHTTERFVKWNGTTYLNINTRRPLAMAPEGEGDPDNFPWLFRFINNFLHTPESDVLPTYEFFLTELRRAYLGALNNKPTSGHIMIFAGPPGRGKSLLTTVISRMIFGSAADAGDFLVAGKGFNKDLAESFIWFIDDNKSTTSAAQHRNFSEAIKKHAATPEVTYHPKFKDACQIPWYGRIIVTCNDDPDSLAIIPDLDIAIRDKICLFKISDWKAEFLPNNEMRSLLEQELPCFLRWLVDGYEPPEEILTPNEPRYGILPYHHPDMIETAKDSSALSGTGQILEIWRNRMGTRIDSSDMVEHVDGVPYWVGNAVELMAAISELEELQVHLRSFAVPVVFGRALNGLMKTESYPPLQRKPVRHRTRGTLWMIELPTTSEGGEVPDYV